MQLDDVLRKLIGSHRLEKQSDIYEKLLAMKIDVEQSTISRALHRIQATKRRGVGGKVYYQLLAPSFSGMQNLVYDVAHNNMLVVIKTRNGAASHVAQLIDESDLKNILGTLAGDDTIFITPRDVKKIGELLTDIQKFFKKVLDNSFA